MSGRKVKLSKYNDSRGRISEKKAGFPKMKVSLWVCMKTHDLGISSNDVDENKDGLPQAGYGKTLSS